MLCPYDIHSYIITFLFFLLFCLNQLLFGYSDLVKVLNSSKLSEVMQDSLLKIKG